MATEQKKQEIYQADVKAGHVEGEEEIDTKDLQNGVEAESQDIDVKRLLRKVYVFLAERGNATDVTETIASCRGWPCYTFSPSLTEPTSVSHISPSDLAVIADDVHR